MAGALQCPADRSALSLHRQGELEFFDCSSCHGLWFRRGGLVAAAREPAVSRAGGPPGIGPASTAGRSCPDCRVPLQAQQHEGIEVDRCVRCWGVWLDAGEFDQVAEWYRRQPAVAPASPFPAMPPAAQLRADAGGSPFDRLDLFEIVLEAGSWAPDAAGWVAEGIGHFVGSVFENVGDLFS